MLVESPPGGQHGRVAVAEVPLADHVGGVAAVLGEVLGKELVAEREVVRLLIVKGVVLNSAMKKYL